MARKQLILGAEYDQPLREALRGVLHELGAEKLDSSWGVGGSQEIASAAVMVAGQRVEIEAETYIGLSITGDAALVDQIAELVEKKRPSQQNNSAP